MLVGPDLELAATIGFSGFSALRCRLGGTGHLAPRGTVAWGQQPLVGGAQGRLAVGGGNKAIMPVTPPPPPPTWSCWSACGQGEF